MIIPGITLLLCVFVGVLVWLNNKGLSELHAKRAEKHHLTLLNKNLAVLRDAKHCLQKIGDFEQRLDGMLIEVRQSTRFLKEHNLDGMLAEVQAATEKAEDIQILVETNLRQTESLMNDPRVQRAIKSG